MLVNYDSFVAVSTPDRGDPTKLHDPKLFDFALAAGSPAIDKGIPIPNVTDGFAGVAPDMGAHEAEQQIFYGPRGLRR